MNKTWVKVLLIFLLNIGVFTSMFIIQNIWLNHIETFELYGVNDVLRNVSFMNANGTNMNTALAVSLFLMFINMLLLRRWIGVNHWILYSVLFFILSLICSVLIVFKAVSSFA